MVAEPKRAPLAAAAEFRLMSRAAAKTSRCECRKLILRTLAGWPIGWPSGVGGGGGGGGGGGSSAENKLSPRRIQSHRRSSLGP